MVIDRFYLDDEIRAALRELVRRGEAVEVVLENGEHAWTVPSGLAKLPKGAKVVTNA